MLLSQLKIFSPYIARPRFLLAPERLFLSEMADRLCVDQDIFVPYGHQLGIVLPAFFPHHRRHVIGPTEYLVAKHTKVCELMVVDRDQENAVVTQQVSSQSNSRVDHR